MPSWNIHIAQTEQLLERGGAVARTVRDANAFLLGNMVPDIFVGYMVPGIEHPIPYRITHFATPEPIPKPREREFWDRFVAPQAQLMREAGGLMAPRPHAVVEPASITPVASPPTGGPSEPGGVAPRVVVAAPTEEVPLARSRFDLTLGAWAHLLADNIWNTRVNEYLDAHGGKPSEGFRIKKQADFDAFGRTLKITSVPRETDAFAAAAEAFPQYPIGRRYVHDTITVIHEIVRTNGGTAEHLPYRLLTDAFFASTFAEVIETTEQALEQRLRESA